MPQYGQRAILPSYKRLVVPTVEVVATDPEGSLCHTRWDTYRVTTIRSTMLSLGSPFKGYGQVGPKLHG